MNAVVCAHIDQHLRIFGKIAGGSEHAGMSRDAAHVTGGGIMHDAAKRHAVLLFIFGGRDARQQRLVRQIARIVHAQRRVDLIVRKFGEGLAGKAANNFAHEHEVDVAVNELHDREARLVWSLGPYQYLLGSRSRRERVLHRAECQKNGS